MYLESSLNEDMHRFMVITSIRCVAKDVLGFAAILMTSFVYVMCDAMCLAICVSDDVMLSCDMCFG